MFNLVSRIRAVKTFKGIDNGGLESVVFIFKNKPEFELKTTKIASRIVTTHTEFRLFISLLDDNPTSEEIFGVFVEDLLGSVEVARDEKEVLEILAKRFQYWTDLFKRKREQMDERWVQGFAGELWFLKHVLSPRIGIDNAIKAWTGPEKANQDFITTNQTFEIKTKSQQAKSIRISNENQLSRGMYLVIIEVSKSSEISDESFNLSSLINSIHGKIMSPETHAIFNGKLLELGLFPIEEALVYDRFSYDFKNISFYKIDSKFPVIDHVAIPEGIIKYSYEIAEANIDNLKISEDEVWI